MKKGFIKTAASILGITALLLFAGAADAKKEVGSEAPAASHKLKKGALCAALGHSDAAPKWSCRDVDTNDMDIAEIYNHGWRVVAVIQYGAVLIIEEQ